MTLKLVSTTSLFHDHLKRDSVENKPANPLVPLEKALREGFPPLGGVDRMPVTSKQARCGALIDFSLRKLNMYVCY